jgi:hypothetical protein
MLFEPASGFGGVVLVNGDCAWSLRRDLLVFAMATAGASAAGRELPPIPEPRTPATVDGAEMYEGTFGPVRVAPEGYGLVAEVAGASAALEIAGADAFASPLPPLARFPLRFEREGDAVIALAHGSAWYAREGTASAAPPEPDPSWEPLLGHYRGYGLSVNDVRVLVRRGRLRLTGGLEGWDEELVRLPDGSFRVGTETWWPDRIAFDTEIGGRATRAVMNGSPLYRTFTD